jgi:hypothetical protein
MSGSDNISAQEITCQPPSRRDSLPPFGIAEAADHDGGQHEQIAGRRRCEPLRQGKADHQRTAQRREQPEGGFWSLHGEGQALQCRSGRAWLPCPERVRFSQLRQIG